MTRRGPGGLAYIDVANEHGEATLCTQGAQLTHWHPRSSPQPVTFMAGAAQTLPGKPMRGGMPICWPWFGPHPRDAAMPSHGFARNLVWQAGDVETLADGATRVSLTLRDDDRTRRWWPAPFRLDYRVTVGPTLRAELVTTNTGTEPLVLTEAVHTYFLVGDIGAVEVLGLDGTGYVDSAAGGERRTQSGPVRFDGEVDRVFLGTDSDCVIVDAQLRRRITVRKSGGRSTIVWNPWAAKAARLADLGDAPGAQAGWRQMVCVESGNALDDRVRVAPGDGHVLSIEYLVGPCA